MTDRSNSERPEPRDFAFVSTFVSNPRTQWRLIDTRGFSYTQFSSVSFSAARSNKSWIASCLLRLWPFPVLRYRTPTSVHLFSRGTSAFVLLSPPPPPPQNKSSWLLLRYISEQPRDNVRVLQGGRRGHDHDEQAAREPDPSPDSGYEQPPWHCRGSPSRSPR